MLRISSEYMITDDKLKMLCMPGLHAGVVEALGSPSLEGIILSQSSYQMLGVLERFPRSIKGSKTNKWETMSRNWGANWQSLSYLNGQSLSFRVQVSNGRILTALNVVPSTWKFGQSFKSNVQFQIFILSIPVIYLSMYFVLPYFFPSKL